MSLYLTLEDEVRDIIRKNRWLILSTSSFKGVPQSSVVVYASDGYIIYILTGKNTNKIKNLTNNPRVSVTIPFYKNLLHRMISMAPPASISFRARVETLDFGDSTATEFYQKILNFKLPEDIEENSVWLKFTPGNSTTCHGVGVSLLELRDPQKAHKIIKLTNTNEERS